MAQFVAGDGVDADNEREDVGQVSRHADDEGRDGVRSEETRVFDRTRILDVEESVAADHTESAGERRQCEHSHLGSHG